MNFLAALIFSPPPLSGVTVHSGSLCSSLYISVSLLYMYFKLQDFKDGETGEYSVCCSIVLCIRQTLTFEITIAVQSLCFQRNNLVFTGTLHLTLKRKHFLSALN